MKPHHLTRRSATTPALLLSAALLLSGCGALGEGDEVFNRDREGTVEVPVQAPETFVTKADWSTPNAPGAPVVMGSIGIVTFDGGQDDHYLPMALNPADGSQVWSAYDALRSPAAPPSLHIVESGGQAWVVAVTYEGKDVTVSTYNPMFTGKVTPVHTKKFTPESKTAPRVVAKSDGVLVVGAKDASIAQYHPHSDELTVLKGLPKKGDKAPRPIESFKDGVLLAYDKDGFVYFANQGGWESTKIAPDGVDASKGEVLASSGGVIVVEWPLRGGGSALWVHDALSGNPLAGGGIDDAQKVDRARDAEAPLVQSADGDVLAWGEFLFDRSIGEVRSLDLGGGQARSARAGVVYADGARAPLAGGSAEGFDGAVALDWEKGEPVQAFGAVPAGFSYLGQGVFGENGAVYAVNLD